MTERRFRNDFRERRALLERLALRELAALRDPLFREIEMLRRDPDYNPGKDPHRSCQRELNQMRISPLEAKDIEMALRHDPELRPMLPRVRRRLEQELAGLADNSERQNFDCPLLDGKRCMVHHAAKPIGCLAWNPGLPYSRAAWKAFAKRDKLNDKVYGRNWKLKVIPLWLARVLGRFRPRPVAGPRSSGTPASGTPATGPSKTRAGESGKPGETSGLRRGRSRFGRNHGRRGGTSSSLAGDDH